MFRLGFALTALAIAPIAVHAQTQGAALTAYVGAWHVAIPGTPSGVVTGTLTVAADGTGSLSLLEMQVEDSPLTGVRVQGDTLIAETSFFSPVSGQTHTGTITLAPTSDGLAGMIGDRGIGFEMTARRAGPSEASALAPFLGAWQITIADTSLGLLTGTLDVATDGTGTISFAEIGVEAAPVADVHVAEGALVGSTVFLAAEQGVRFSGTLALAPVSNGTLAGTFDAGTRGTHAVTAHRAAR